METGIAVSSHTGRQVSIGVSTCPSVFLFMEALSRRGELVVVVLVVVWVVVCGTVK